MRSFVVDKGEVVTTGRPLRTKARGGTRLRDWKSNPFEFGLKYKRPVLAIHLVLLQRYSILQPAPGRVATNPACKSFRYIQVKAWFIRDQISQVTSPHGHSKHQNSWPLTLTTTDA